MTIDARNVIAQAGGFDVVAGVSGAGSPTASVTLVNSNYDSEADPAGAVTNPGTGTNQTAAPLFADAAAGDFHQATGSPTIDAGSVNPEIGALDLDGNARAQGPAPDIGAYEVNVPAPPAVDTDPPEVTITKGPRDRTTKTKAKFKFTADETGASLECKLDRKAFEPCTSPQKYKLLKPKKHRFLVRATDAAGNVGAATEDRWKVLRD